MKCPTPEICDKRTKKYPDGRRGTAVAYTLVLRQTDETPCDECKAAHTAYKKEYRAANPDYVARQNSYSTTRANIARAAKERTA